MRETGREFGDVLAEAQKLGYAESDPSFDIDGVDAAHKLAILTSVAFGCPVDFGAVHVEGIRHISALDIEYAKELGYRIKLLGIARRNNGGVEQRVHPAMVPDRFAHRGGRWRVQRGRGGRRFRRKGDLRRPWRRSRVQPPRPSSLT